MRSYTRIIIIGAAAATALASSACSSTDPAHPVADHKHVANGKPAQPEVATKPAPPSVKPYLLTTCIVSDEPLESMGGSLSQIYQGQEVKFCCKGCIKEFNDSPGGFISKLN